MPTFSDPYFFGGGGVRGTSLSVRTSGGKGGKKLFHSEFVSDQLEQLLFFLWGGGWALPPTVRTDKELPLDPPPPPKKTKVIPKDQK